MEAQGHVQSEKFSSRMVKSAGFGYGFATLQNPSWTLDQVLLATNGRLISGNSHAGFRSISTDSRTIKPGDLFLAIPGENFDGSRFIGEAIKRGASGIIVSSIPEENVPAPVVLVKDCVKALGDLAAFRRNLIEGLEVIAVTGSSGKTTVKEMTASILSKCGNVIKTMGNFNNLIGLPLSLLPVNFRHDFAVMEMGMNKPGEIARLTEIADPDIACINNIQPAHLEGLGSIDGVAKAKGELFKHCRSSTVLIINNDDHMVMKLARKIKAKKITFGRKKHSFVRATHLNVIGNQGISYTLHIGPAKSRVRLNVLGEHNVVNSLAAAAMAYSAGAEFLEIVSGLESFEPADSRLKVVELSCGLSLINDSYNANPASMMAAMTTVKGIRKGGKTVAVLGDMLELGSFSSKAHAQIGEFAAKQGFDYLFAMGEYAGDVVAAAKRVGMSGNAARKFKNKDEIVNALIGLWRQGKISAKDTILLKGSRGMRMEDVLSGLKQVVWE